MEGIVIEVSWLLKKTGYAIDRNKVSYLLSAHKNVVHKFVNLYGYILPFCISYVPTNFFTKSCDHAPQPWCQKMAIVKLKDETYMRLIYSTSIELSNIVCTTEAKHEPKRRDMLSSHLEEVCPAIKETSINC